MNSFSSVPFASGRFEHSSCLPQAPDTKAQWQSLWHSSGSAWWQSPRSEHRFRSPDAAMCWWLNPSVSGSYVSGAAEEISRNIWTIRCLTFGTAWALYRTMVSSFSGSWNALLRFAICDIPMDGLLTDLFSHRYSPFVVQHCVSNVLDIVRQGKLCHGTYD